MPEIEYVSKELFEERTDNITQSLGEIKKDVVRIHKRIDTIRKYARANGNGNGMSGKKQVAIIGGLIILARTIEQIVKAVL